MSADLEPAIDDTPDEFLQYRALSSLAVISLIVGLLSALAVLDWFWIVLPISGLLLGVCAWRQVKSRPEELTGLPVAKAAVAISALFLVAGPSWLTYEFLHEVPEGCEPISYSALQPDATVLGEKIPPSALALDGKRVFIKGYVFPGEKKDGIKTFVLVRDQGDCCFGGNPKITDRIQVTLTDPLRLTFHKRLHAVAGVFHVAPASAVDGMGGVYYHLEADHLH